MRVNIMTVAGLPMRAALCLWLAVATVLPMTAPAFAANSPQYLPPMAGQVDPSAFQQPTPKAAPAPARSSASPMYDNNDDSAYSQSAPASKSDRTKDLLRQALERHNAGDTQGAERLFKQVLSIDSNNADANFNLGAMAEDRGDLNGALRYYQSAARVNPNDSDIHDAVASVQDKLRQQQVAQQTTQQLQQKQQMRNVAQDAAAAYKAGNYDKAIAALQQIARQDPNDANVQFGLAQAYRGKGDNAKAREYLNRAISLAPDNDLYRATMEDLSHSSSRSQQSQPRVAQDQPMPAPDYRGGNGNGYGSGRGSRGLGGDSQGLQSYDNNDIADNSMSDPNGGVQPFTSQGERQLYGHAFGGNMGSGMGFGMGGGLGGLAGGLSGLVGGGSYYSGRGTRLVRSGVTGALAGAALGGLTSMHSAGGFKGGAIRGALTGGLMGLFMGGF